MAKEKYKGRYIVWGTRRGWVGRIFVAVLVTAFLFFMMLATDNRGAWVLWVGILFTGSAGLWVLVQLLYPKFVFIDPDSARGWEVKKVLEDERAAREGRFGVDAAGFVFPGREGPRMHGWEEVESLFGFKQDLMTIDEVTLDIFLRGGVSYRITESMGGWLPFLEQVYIQFPTVKRDWEWDVVQPPFARNMTLLYDRQGRPMAEAEASSYRG